MNALSSSSIRYNVISFLFRLVAQMTTANRIPLQRRWQVLREQCYQTCSVEVRHILDYRIGQISTRLGQLYGLASSMIRFRNMLDLDFSNSWIWVLVLREFSANILKTKRDRSNWWKVVKDDARLESWTIFGEFSCVSPAGSVNFSLFYCFLKVLSSLSVVLGYDPGMDTRAYRLEAYKAFPNGCFDVDMASVNREKRIIFEEVLQNPAPKCKLATWNAFWRIPQNFPSCTVSFFQECGHHWHRGDHWPGFPGWKEIAAGTSRSWLCSRETKPFRGWRTHHVLRAWRDSQLMLSAAKTDEFMNSSWTSEVILKSSWRHIVLSGVIAYTLAKISVRTRQLSQVRKAAKLQIPRKRSEWNPTLLQYFFCEEDKVLWTTYLSQLLQKEKFKRAPTSYGFVVENQRKLEVQSVHSLSSDSTMSAQPQV